MSSETYVRALVTCAGAALATSTTVLAQIPLQEGDWPKAFGYYVEPIPYDVDGDGTLELIVNGTTEGITIYRHDGSIFSELPLPPDAVYVREVIAAGDLQGDGVVDIVAIVSGTGNAFNSSNRLMIWDPAGNCPFRSCDLPFESNTMWTHAGPTLVDLEGDGTLEIIITWVVPTDYLGVMVLQVESDGRFIGRRWQRIIDAGDRLTTATNAAVGDIDGDGRPEILFGSTGTYLADGGFLYAFRHDGKPVENWPIELDEGLENPPVLADLTGDGRLEIIINGYGLHDRTAGLKVWNHRAELLWTGVGRGRTPIVADLTGDGLPEVLTQAAAYFPDGTWTGWGYRTTNPNGVSVADIDSDGDMEVLLGGSGSEGLLAFHHDGTPVDGFPLFIDPQLKHTFMTPVLADLDGDGDIEVVVTGAYLAVWDLPGVYDAAAVEWLMYQHDPGRVGRYEGNRGANRADLNGDGVVGVSDLLILLGNWGPCGDCNDCPADLNGDCNVGVADLLILLANWG